MQATKKTNKKRIQKAVVTQNNRFVYAKYDMNTNELKMFMWIVAQINSQKDTLFQVCQMPLNQIFEVLNHQSEENYTYVKNLIDNMARKTYIEDFKLLDEKTMKEIEIHRAMPLFQFLEYKKGASNISYKLNDSLMEYLLEQKRDFTQLKFSDIQQMKSAYSIRIYNMLLCELKQNRQNLKINLSVLQNLLEVPKSLYEWFDFNRRVLKQAEKDINSKSNLVLLDIKTYKTGRKITDLEFIFDYKNNDKRIAQEKLKEENLFKKLKEILSSYIGKSIYDDRFGEMIISHYEHNEEDKKISIIAQRKSDDKFVAFGVKNFKDIKSLEKLKDKAEELFYLDKQRVLKAKEAQKYRNLFN
ncbi:replication initiation protein [Campylobacter volucris]|uniref:Replication initiation protein n=2 Tax=Campylobacter TaxID=194 RepID=A0AAE6IX52_9BACT|nr:replication initiation protein [Campylobacter volucris]EAJ9170259.1 replication initiation protein [Campylobacter jejuni]EAK0451866.1 replication initiation protein [Campylobacter lari]EAK9880049.1 replication initiation protein [Campylobacter lari]KAB0577433.1 replication initiation protein [Campylobacter volucris]MCV3399204.1 replication initiation protein [Campylobacter lari]